MMHLAVGKDSEMKLTLCRLDVSGLQQEGKRIIERCGRCVATSCCDSGFIIMKLTVRVTEGLLDGNSALHDISECKRLQDLCSLVNIVGNLYM